MTAEHTAQLFAAFPHLYRGRHLPRPQTRMAWGFECDDGWFVLISRLSQAITDSAARHPAVQEVMAIQVKEKFGTLRFDVQGADAPINALLDAAEAQSAQTCERDGAPGHLRQHPGRSQKTLCDPCARTVGYTAATPREHGGVDSGSGMSREPAKFAAEERPEDTATPLLLYSKTPRLFTAYLPGSA